MDNYSNSEKVDMLLVYGFCQGNGRQSVRVYMERFPGRRIPNHQTFANIERHLRETGSFERKFEGRGRNRTTRTIENEEDILVRVEEEPNISTRQLEHELEVPKTIVNDILKEQFLHPYHIQTVQELLPIDPPQRLLFCQFIRNRRLHDLNFSKKILFTDEASFTRSGVTNLHNEHVYADENPYAIKVTHHQHQFKLNVWAGIIDRYLIGPVVLPDNLNGNMYLHFLQNTLPILLEDVPLLIRQGMWYMHDGAPPHYSLDVRQYLHDQYPNRWIGRGNDAPVRWPPRSPDLNMCDFFLWGALKTEIYKTTVNTREELWQRILNASNRLNNLDTLDKVQFHFLRSVSKCIQENGGHFAHLLN